MPVIRRDGSGGSGRSDDAYVTESGFGASACRVGGGVMAGSVASHSTGRGMGDGGNRTGPRACAWAAYGSGGLTACTPNGSDAGRSSRDVDLVAVLLVESAVDGARRTASMSTLDLSAEAGVFVSTGLLTADVVVPVVGVGAASTLASEASDTGCASFNTCNARSRRN